MRQQLAEVIPFEYQIVERAQQKPGVLLTLEGTFQRAGTKNANGRVYPLPLWQKLMSDEDVNDRIKARRMLGELDHPSSGATALSRVSHVVTEHRLLGDSRVSGRLDILDTPMGQIAATLAKAGVQLGVSSRGDGSVEKKGDFDEVQNDFRLETYDLVLKPSTPGAYPRIVESEEKAKENLDLIANAVEGLVKSTNELDVLLECHKIISVLEGCETRREQILAELKSKLGSGQKEQENTLSTSEDEMSGTTAVPTAPAAAPQMTLSPEMKDYLQEWVNRGVSEAVAAKNEEINELNGRIVGLVDERDELANRMYAAEQLIEEFTRKVRELSENRTTDEELQKRFDASVALLDEAMSRLQELGETQRRLAAAEELLQASICKAQVESIAGHIEHRIGDLDESAQESLRELLMDCESIEEVDQRFSRISSLIETHGGGISEVVREPLPPRSKTLQEDAIRGAVNSGPKDFITQRILAKIAG